MKFNYHTMFDLYINKSYKTLGETKYTKILNPILGSRYKENNLFIKTFIKNMTKKVPDLSKLIGL